MSNYFEDISIREYEDSQKASFYSAIIITPIVLLVGIATYATVARHLKLKSNIHSIFILFILGTLFGFINRLVISVNGWRLVAQTTTKHTETGLLQSVAAGDFFILAAFVTTQLCGYELVYPDSKSSEKVMYWVSVGIQGLLAAVIFGLQLRVANWKQMWALGYYSFNTYNWDSRIYNLEDVARYMTLAFAIIGTFFTTLIMWGSVNFRRRKATFPQVAQHRIVSYAICFPAFVFYLAFLVQSIAVVLYRNANDKLAIIHIPNLITATSIFIYVAVIVYLVGWAMLITEWIKGNRAAPGNPSMGDKDLKPKSLADGQEKSASAQSAAV